MKNFAYLDKHPDGSMDLKITSVEGTRDAMIEKGVKVVETALPCEGGYPRVRGKQVTITGLGKAYWGREVPGREIKLASYPELLDYFNLFVSLM